MVGDDLNELQRSFYQDMGTKYEARHKAFQDKLDDNNPDADGNLQKPEDYGHQTNPFKYPFEDTRKGSRHKFGFPCTANLNPDHSHFIMIDDGVPRAPGHERMGLEREMRFEFENRLTEAIPPLPHQRDPAVRIQQVRLDGHFCAV